jgi:hypothetical protein
MQESTGVFIPAHPTTGASPTLRRSRNTRGRDADSKDSESNQDSSITASSPDGVEYPTYANPNAPGNRSNTISTPAQNDSGNRSGKDSGSSTGSGEMDPVEKQQIQDLQKRDREVKAHEMAHVSAGASSPTYEYETGPDGRQYAIGGEAQIDVSSEGEPRKDIEKAGKVRRAAMAPAEPSQQDRQVAASADKLKLEALVELRKETRGGGGDSEEVKLEGIGQPAAAQNVLNAQAPFPLPQLQEQRSQTSPNALRAVETPSGYDRKGRPTHTPQDPVLDLLA